MLEVLLVVAQVAASDASVLVLGESGTGKEHVAQALHVNSPRMARPFVPLHCAALTTSVLESELFGHTRGAFTGAERERRGRLAAVDGGTLFLDEVAEIPQAGPEFTELTNEGLKAARDRAVLELEGRFVKQLMARHGGHVSLAAREASMYRSYLQKLLARHRGGS